MKDLKKNYQKVCDIIKYQFVNPELLYQAFTRSSYAKENGLEDNENLEFIGDRILGLFITEALIVNYGYMTSDIGNDNKIWGSSGRFALVYELDESNITELKNYLLSNEFLAKCTYRLGLQELLYLGKNDINNKVWKNVKVKADLLEAILGAVAIDSNWNYNILRGMVCTLTDIYNNMPSIRKDDLKYLPEYMKEIDSITVIKELSEKGRCKPPKYNYKETYDKNNNRIWSCKCILDSCKTHRYMMEGPSVGIIDINGVAEASTKKEAKRIAAQIVLNKFYAL